LNDPRKQESWASKSEDVGLIAGALAGFQVRVGKHLFDKIWREVLNFFFICQFAHPAIQKGCPP